MFYKKVKLEEGVQVQFLGVYVLHWQRNWGKPEVGFVECRQHHAAQSDDCMLPKVASCCCDCIHHLADISHPGTDGGMFTRRGWLCAAPTFLLEGSAFSGWDAHGLCEEYASRAGMMLDALGQGSISADKLARGLLAAIRGDNGENGDAS